MNYFSLHTASNLITGVISLTYKVKVSEGFKLIKATDGQVSLFYERQRQVGGIGIGVDLYSVIPKPKIPDHLPLSKDIEHSLQWYVDRHKSHETPARMAWVWRVSESKIRSLMKAPLAA